ncbi:MAG: ABC transporter substrate-binding protein [Thermoplasmatota archaeon]
MWKWFSIVVIVSLLPLFLGCLDDPAQKGDLKFTDPLGHEVVLERIPERIVTLSPAITETVFALGAGDKVIATDNVSNYPPEASGLPKVFGYNYLAREELVMLDPDLIIMDKTLDISENAYNSVKDLGLPVYRIFPKDMEEVLEAIIGIGNITGTPEKANGIVEDFRNRMGAVSSYMEGVSDDDRPGILLVTFYDGAYDPWVSTDSTMAGGLIEAAGGNNVISDDTGIVVTVSVERVIGADPDIIICTQSSVWPTESKDKIMSDDRWKDISAVRENRVFEVDGDIIDRTGPRLILGLEEMHEHIREYIEE